MCVCLIYTTTLANKEHSKSFLCNCLTLVRQKLFKLFRSFSFLLYLVYNCPSVQRRSKTDSWGLLPRRIYTVYRYCWNYCWRYMNWYLLLS